MKFSDPKAARRSWHEFQHLAFDIDGTLLNNNLAHVWAWQDAIESEQLFFPHLTLFLQMSLPPRQLAEKFAFALRDPDTAQRITRRARQLYAEKYATLVEPYSGVYNLLEQLRALGRKLYAVTSASRQEADAALIRGRLPEYFDDILTVDEAEDGKPGLEPLSGLRQKIGPRQTLIALGDSPYDLKTATASGVPFVYIGHGGFPREWFKQAHSSFFNCHEMLDALAGVTARCRKSA